MKMLRVSWRAREVAAGSVRDTPCHRQENPPQEMEGRVRPAPLSDPGRRASWLTSTMSAPKYPASSRVNASRARRYTSWTLSTLALGWRLDGTGGGVLSGSRASPSHTGGRRSRAWPSSAPIFRGSRSLRCVFAAAECAAWRHATGISHPDTAHKPHAAARHGIKTLGSQAEGRSPRELEAEVGVEDAELLPQDERGLVGPLEIGRVDPAWGEFVVEGDGAGHRLHLLEPAVGEPPREVVPARAGSGFVGVCGRGLAQRRRDKKQHNERSVGRMNSLERT